MRNLIDVYYYQLRDLTGVNYGWVLRRFVAFFLVGLLVGILTTKAFSDIRSDFQTGSIEIWYDDTGQNKKVYNYADATVTRRVEGNEHISELTWADGYCLKFSHYHEAVNRDSENQRPAVETDKAPVSVPPLDVPTDAESSQPTNISEPTSEPAMETTARPATQGCGTAADLEIVSVVERRSPRRLAITLRNNEQKFVSLNCWKLRVNHQNGMVSEASLKGKTITYQKSKGEQFADTAFVFTPKRLFDRVPETGLECIHLQYFYGRQPGYSEGDVVQLVFEDEVKSTFQAAIAASPMRPVRKRLVTTWGCLKHF